MSEATANDFYLKLEDLSDILHKKAEVVQSEIRKLGGDVFLTQGRAYLAPDVVRLYFESLGFHYSHRVISFQMLKGGVSKTTTCLNVGLRAAMFGFRVLFVDLDQQANLSFALGVDDLETPVFVDIIEKKSTLKEAILPCGAHVGLLPSNLNNSVIERVLLHGTRNLAKVVQGPLEEVRNDYDLVLIDTAPSLSALNTAVTCASDEIVLPINPDKFTLFGVQKHLADLEQIKTDFEVQPKVKILFTRYDSREGASAIYFQQCKDRFGAQLLPHYIRQCAEVKNTIATGKTIYDSKGNAKVDYDRVSRDLLGLW